jgi:hypothetical protein
LPFIAGHQKQEHHPYKVFLYQAEIAERNPLAYPGDNSPTGTPDWMVPLNMRHHLPQIKAMAMEAQKESSAILFAQKFLILRFALHPSPSLN